MNPCRVVAFFHSSLISAQLIVAELIQPDSAVHYLILEIVEFDARTTFIESYIKSDGIWL